MITAAVITLSDKGSQGKREDESGPVIREMIGAAGITVRYTEILPDEREIIGNRLRYYSTKVDLIFTTGGTGLSPRDVAPEATRDVIDKEIPGIPEAMRMEGLGKTRRAMLSRAVAGVRGSCLIVNLPGSPKAVRESLEVIMDALPHAVEKIKGDTADCAPLAEEAGR